MAVFLPIRGPRGDLVGTVMILADMKSVTEGTMERIVTPQVRTILVKIAMFMRRNAPASANDASQEIAMPAVAAAPAPVNLSSTTVIEKLPAASVAALAAAAAAAPALGPREVEQILELELVAEPAPAAPPPAKAAPETNKRRLHRPRLRPRRKPRCAVVPPGQRSQVALRMCVACRRLHRCLRSPRQLSLQAPCSRRGLKRKCLSSRRTFRFLLPGPLLRP